MCAQLLNDEIGSEAPPWEPEPYELPLVHPVPYAPPSGEDRPDLERPSRVLIIDLT